jgi:hypothetical protein
MFNKITYEERLAAWREFRDGLEEHEDPIQEVIEFYNTAPEVSMHTDPWSEEMWPTPWELINENQYCPFTRVLGMYHSLQLTERFKESSFEIHIGIDRTKSETYYLLFVDDIVIGLNDSYVRKHDLPTTYTSQRTYKMPRQ